MEWVGLVEVPDETTAGMWRELLRNNGIPAAPKLAGVGNYVGIVFGAAVSNECWVMVQECDVENARDILRPMAERMNLPRRRRPS